MKFYFSFFALFSLLTIGNWNWAIAQGPVYINPNLHECLDDDVADGDDCNTISTSDIPASDNTAAWDGRLYTPSGNQEITGFYDAMTTQRCPDDGTVYPTGNCVVQVRAFFQPVCPNNDPTCEQAAEVFVHVSTQVHTNTIGLVAAVYPAPVPVTHTIASISGAGGINGECDPGEVMIGVEANGDPKCVSALTKCQKRPFRAGYYHGNPSLPREPYTTISPGHYTQTVCKRGERVVEGSANCVLPLGNQSRVGNAIARQGAYRHPNPLSSGDYVVLARNYEVQCTSPEVIGAVGEVTCCEDNIPVPTAPYIKPDPSTDIIFPWGYAVGECSPNYKVRIAASNPSEMVTLGSDSPTLPAIPLKKLKRMNEVFPLNTFYDGNVAEADYRMPSLRANDQASAPTNPGIIARLGTGTLVPSNPFDLYAWFLKNDWLKLNSGNFVGQESTAQLSNKLIVPSTMPVVKSPLLYARFSNMSEFLSKLVDTDPIQRAALQNACSGFSSSYLKVTDFSVDVVGNALVHKVIKNPHGQVNEYRNLISTPADATQLPGDQPTDAASLGEVYEDYGTNICNANQDKSEIYIAPNFEPGVNNNPNPPIGYPGQDIDSTKVSASRLLETVIRPRNAGGGALFTLDSNSKASKNIVGFNGEIGREQSNTTNFLWATVYYIFEDSVESGEGLEGFACSEVYAFPIFNTTVSCCTQYDQNNGDLHDCELGAVIDGACGKNEIW